MRTSPAFLLALLLGLSACGGGGGEAAGGAASGAASGGAGATVNNPMPLAQGDRWVYRDQDGGYEVVAVESVRSVQGLQAAVVATVGLGPQGAAREESLVARASDGVLELPDEADLVSVALGNVKLLPLPLQVGPNTTVLDRNLSTGYDFDDDNRPDAMTVRIEQQVLAIESVSVPAGNFPGSAKVRTVIRLTATLSSTGRPLNASTTVDEWFAPDTGLVRDSTVIQVEDVRSTTVRELTAYSVAGRRSDTAAPTPVSRIPEAGSTSKFLYSVQVEFNEPPDLATVLNGGLAVLNASGQPLTTRLRQLSPTGFELALDTPPPTGTYTVNVAATLADQLGNTRPAQQWTWAVDRSGPSVLRSTPARGAVDVALNTSVELVFDEPINTATATADSIQLLGRNRTLLAATVTVVDARTVRLTPAAALEPGVIHTVRVDMQVTDTGNNGNANAVEVQFRTAQGQFGYPAPVAGGLGRQLEVGDYNGDGLADLLDFPDSSTAALRVHARLGAGGLDAPRLWPLPDVPNCGNASVMRAADMNADGRLDVVVRRTNSDCGVQVLQQQPGGTLALLAQLPSRTAYQLALADLNGDGRVDIVASAGDEDTVTVWMQTAPGVFGAGTPYPAVTNARGELAVGDVNGDGRPDIVLTSGQFNADRALTIVPQRPDGSFGLPVSRAVPSTAFGMPLALADLNGDGRLDIVVAAPGIGALWVLRQAADGTLESPVSILGAGAGLVVADFNGDGRLDIAASMGSYSIFVRVHLQAVDGSFDAGRMYIGPEGGSASTQLGVLDANGDGRLDIIVAGPHLLLQLGGATPSAAAVPRERRLRWLPRSALVGAVPTAP